MGKTKDKEYDSETGQFRKVCQNPLCNEPFWGRRNKEYCCLKCKNQVTYNRWRKRNPKLNAKELELRENYRILVAVSELHGSKQWIDRSALVNLGFNGELYHNYERVEKSGKYFDCITLFNMKVYSSKNQVYITKF